MSTAGAAGLPTSAVRGFGSADVPPVGHVGLFPFNESALRRLARKMGADAGIPGRLLQVALEEVLVKPDRISGTAPIRTGAPKSISTTVSSHVPALKRGVAGEVGDRLLRANVIWGDDRQITSSTVLEAFALPPLADGPAPVPESPGPRARNPATRGRKPSRSPGRTGAPAPARSGQCLEPAPGGVPGKLSRELPRMALPRGR